MKSEMKTLIVKIPYGIDLGNYCYDNALSADQMNDWSAEYICLLQARLTEMGVETERTLSGNDIEIEDSALSDGELCETRLEEIISQSEMNEMNKAAYKTALKAASL